MAHPAAQWPHTLEGASPATKEGGLGRLGRFRVLLRRWWAGLRTDGAGHRDWRGEARACSVRLASRPCDAAAPVRPCAPS